MTLEASALKWLRYDQQCLLVMLERSPWPDGYRYRPDVIGITADRYVIEIECKRTASDFRANKDKKWIDRFPGWEAWRRYFMVPTELAPIIEGEAAASWGIMVPSGAGRRSISGVQVLRKCKRNQRARPLDMKDFMRCVRHQAGTLVSLATKLSQSS